MIGKLEILDKWLQEQIELREWMIEKNYGKFFQKKRIEKLKTEIEIFDKVRIYIKGLGR